MAIRNRYCRSGGAVADVGPGNVKVRVDLVEVELIEVGDRVNKRQPGGVLRDPEREGAQQRRRGARLAVEGEAQGVVGEQLGGVRPVPGGLEMADGVGGVAVIGAAIRRRSGQPGHGFGRRAA